MYYNWICKTKLILITFSTILSRTGKTKRANGKPKTKKKKIRQVSNTSIPKPTKPLIKKHWCTKVGLSFNLQICISKGGSFDKENE